MKRNGLLLLVLLLQVGLNRNNVHAQTPVQNKELRTVLHTIASKYKATVGVGVIHIESGDTVTLNNEVHFPMQSVYKFPQALAVMNQIDQGKLRLNQVYHVTKADLLDETWSPLKKKYPEGNVDLTVAELLDYSVSKSDNIACDILFQLAKGTKPVNQFIHQIGIKNMEIVATEHEMRSDWKIQYANWSTPLEMARLLEGFQQKKYLSDSSNLFLMNLMIESMNDPGRIKALIPEGTLVAHKTGTSDSRNGVYDACNDVGLITLPDGTHVALSVFVSKSSEGYDNTRKLIAELAKAVYDHYSVN